MMDAQFAYAFTTGMVATVNPCGFAMLPAYLGYFLGTEAGDDESSTSSSLLRGLVVAGAVSAGFMVLFALAGMLVSWTSLGVGKISPWFTVVIGVVLVAAGIAFFRGWTPKLMLPRLDQGGRNRSLWSMFVFGLSYAIASLSCTLPVFTTVVVTSFSRQSFTSGVATFVAYGTGMAMLLTALTLTLALAHRGLATGLRRSLAYVHRISGAIMALMGAYLVWWGIYELRVIHRGELTGSGPVDWMTDWSARLSERISGLDAMTVALTVGLVIAVIVLAALIQADRVARNRDQS